MSDQWDEMYQMGGPRPPRPEHPCVRCFSAEKVDPKDENGMCRACVRHSQMEVAQAEADVMFDVELERRGARTRHRSIAGALRAQDQRWGAKR